ncbi:tRNA1(Val) (adenine(37)-N6)-methyltransferase [Miniphocaeibacter massiliensis]|uniref:tRNA1(Val) (adenine(37)-N6)-methyltransferase n=1 Tax=Miniphocaeibacter massiliensis TaxID=2041841 RepID=UPI000C08C7E4|nr:methyltransferase [Miniphocaeibacter massiliensis]
MIKEHYIPGTNYKINSIEDKFSFGIDAILLSSFAKVKSSDKVLEIGGGTGIISLRMNYLYNPKIIDCVEIQKDNYNVLEKNIEINNLKNLINPINEDINNCFENYKNDSLDIIVTNPPYYKVDAGIKNKNENHYISRYEVYLKLEDIFKFAKYKLKSKGVLYMINRPSRLVDICEMARIYKIEPKNLVPVVSKIGEEPKMILMKFVKNSGANFVFKKPLVVYNEKGEYTEEVKKIYYG